MAKKVGRKSTVKAARPTRRKASPRKRLTPRKQKRGLEAKEAPLSLDAPEVMPLTRMAASAKKFDVGKVRESDLALVAAISPDEAG